MVNCNERGGAAELLDVSTHEGGEPAQAGSAQPLPSVAVVIVTYNSSAVLPGCLDSLPVGLEGVSMTEIVVVDNASSDGCPELAAAWALPGLRVIHMGRNAGYSAAINRAVATLGEVAAVLVLNPDVRLRPGSVAALVAGLDRPRVGVAVPRLTTPTGGLQYSLRREPTVRRALGEALLGGDRAARLGLGERILDTQRYTQSGPVTWATGAAMLISWRAWSEIGPWDESFLLYSEEVEYALRARDLGWQIWFEASAVAEHIGGESDTNPMLAALLAVSKVRLYKRRHPRWATCFYCAVTLGEALRAATGRRTSRAALGALLFPSRRLRHLPGGE